MSNLFILGNGFDVSHELPTQYKYFKKYMCEIISDRHFSDKESLLVLDEMPELPVGQVYTKKGKIYDPYAECKLLYWLIDNAAKGVNDLEWNQFEQLLGSLEFDKIIDKYEEDQHAVSILSETLNTLEGFFFDWIGRIDLLSNRIEPKKMLKRIITDSDLAVSFNYTETIEIVYGLKESNVCYIHGRRESDVNAKSNKKMRLLAETMTD